MANNKLKKCDHAISAHNYHPGTDLYSIMPDKITVVMVTHLFTVSKEVGMAWQSDYMFSLLTFCGNK